MERCDQGDRFNSWSVMGGVCKAFFFSFFFFFGDLAAGRWWSTWFSTSSRSSLATASLCTTARRTSTQCWRCPLAVRRYAVTTTPKSSITSFFFFLNRYSMNQGLGTEPSCKKLKRVSSFDNHLKVPWLFLLTQIMTRSMCKGRWIRVAKIETWKILESVIQP